MGYPDVPMPENRDWDSLPEDYEPVYYTAESVKRAVPDWENPDVDAVWQRARTLTLSPNILRDALTRLPLNPSGATGITGHGRLRNLGPNLTADGIVTHENSVLLIERQDTGQLAFPGGFRNHIGGNIYEDPRVAAAREVKEETNIKLRGFARAILSHAGIAQKSLRNTDNAWIENIAFRFDISDTKRPVPTGLDDAKSAGWYTLSDDVISRMSDTHAENATRLRDQRDD